MLVAVIFLLFLLILSLSVALPKVREDIQRDRDVETMQRGKQYVRAIKLYYGRFHTYPPNIEALVKTSNIRFLRKRYLDPTTGKDDWKPIMLGQNKTPTAMGFFGQPLAGVPLGGTGPGGQNGLSGTNTPGVSGSPFGGGTNAGSGSGMGSSTFSLGNNNSTSATSPANGATGTPGSTPGGDGTNSGSDSSSSGTSNSGVGNGPTFGGAGIIGFSPASPKQSIAILKKKNHYNEWEFTYNPLSDQQMMTGGNAGTIGQPAGSTNNPFGGTSGSGTQPSGGGSGSSGSSPTAPTTPTPTPSPTDPGTPSPQP
jgi:type II secretory pathway pseudopilin PulG